MPDLNVTIANAIALNAKLTAGGVNMALASSAGTIAGTSTDTAVTPAALAATLPHIDVRRFGAKGDGTTDDTTAIQAAINAATTTKTVVFPTGTYKLTSQLTLAAGVHLVSDRSARLVQSGATARMLVANGIAEFAIIGLELQGQGAQDAENAGMEIIRADNCTDFEISNCLITEARGAKAVAIKNCSRVDIDRNTIDEFSVAGIYIMEVCEDIWVTNNVIRDCHRTFEGGFDYSYGVVHGGEDAVTSYGRRIYYLWNTIENIPAWEGLDVHGGEDVWMVGNTIRNCRVGIAANFFRTQASNTIARIHIVDNHITCNDATDVNFAGSANNGMQIAGMTDASVDYYIDSAWVTGNYVTGANVLLQNNLNAGIQCRLIRNAVISDNVCYKNYNAGILLYYGIDNFVISGNVCRDNYGGAIPAGISLRDRDIRNGRISGNILTSDDASFQQLNALQVSQATDAVYERNNQIGGFSPAITSSLIRCERRTVAPTTGTWAVNDIVYNSAPAASGTIGWVCVTAGTPGTWKTFGAISA